MVQAYCVKCRKMVEIENPTIVITSNGRRAVKGKCPYCGTTLYRFVPKNFKL